MDLHALNRQKAVLNGGALPLSRPSEPHELLSPDLPTAPDSGRFLKPELGSRYGLKNVKGFGRFASVVVTRLRYSGWT